MNLSSIRKPSRVRRTTPREPHASRLYRNLAPAYERVWPMVAGRGIWSAIDSIGILPGQRVLEVGVGTGVALARYPRNAWVTGVDLSDEMLAQCQRQIAVAGWKHVDVARMNAEELNFPDESFDVVTSFHVVSVVSNPRRMMSEVVRVCKPGGRILIVNHFRSPNPWIARMVDSAGKVTRHFGWRTDLEFKEMIAELPLSVDRLFKPSPMSLFTTMVATKKANSSPRLAVG